MSRWLAQGHPLHGRRKRRLGHKRRRRCCPGCPGGPTLSPAATAATGERRERRTTPPRALAATLPYKPSAARAAPSVAEAVSTRPVMAAARRRLAARLAYGAKNQGGAGVADEVTPTTPHLDVAGVPPAASAASAGQC